MAAEQNKKFCCGGGWKEKTEIPIPLTSAWKMLPEWLDSRGWDEQP